MLVDLPSLGLAIGRTSYSGFGLFATREFKAGEPLFAEWTPAVTKGSRVELARAMLTKLDPTWVAALHPRAGARFPIIEKEDKTLEVMAKEWKMEPDAVARLVAKGDLNNYVVWLDGVTRAVFPLTSFINHSCQPNAMRNMLLMPMAKERTARALIATCTAIAKGQEITVSYLNPSEMDNKRAVRHVSLRFACQCSVCAQGEDGPTPKAEETDDDIKDAVILLQAMKCDAGDACAAATKELRVVLDKERKRFSKGKAKTKALDNV